VNVEEHLAVPYILETWSERNPSGRWSRRAAFPELPGCEAEAATAVEAIERVEEVRVRYIVEHLERGEQLPVPRPPLRA
jgi:predicted RNase H-like HicB family nuclease